MPGTSHDMAADLTEQRRMARALLARAGRGFAEACGFPVMNNPSKLFQLLILAMLTSRRGDYRAAVRAAQELRDRWESPTRLAQSTPEQRARVIQEAGLRRADEIAAVLGDLAEAVVERYQRDLRRLRRAAHNDPTEERRLLTELPGIDDRVVDLLFRDLQVIWPEVGPFVDRRALEAARKLGLARTAAQLATVAGGNESERLAWLAGTLARVDLENRYGEFQQNARR